MESTGAARELESTNDPPVPPTNQASEVVYNPLSGLCHGYVSASFDPMNMCAALKAAENARIAALSPWVEETFDEPIVSAGVKTHLALSSSQTGDSKNEDEAIDPSWALEKQLQSTAHLAPHYPTYVVQSKFGYRLIALTAALMALIGTGYISNMILADPRVTTHELSATGLMAIATSDRRLLLLVALVTFFFCTVLGLLSSLRTQWLVTGAAPRNSEKWGRSLV